MTEQLMSAFEIRGVRLRNRIFSTGHQTRMVVDGLPTEQMIAYHAARARGGAGLIISEAARVHETALSDSPAINASTDACVEAAQWLEMQGVRAIMGNCGFFGHYQVAVQERINTPFFSSSLMMLPMMVRCLPGNKKVGVLTANGGRVLNVTALGNSVRDAQARAYEAVDRIKFPEGFCRRDIGWREMEREG